MYRLLMGLLLFAAMWDIKISDTSIGISDTNATIYSPLLAAFLVLVRLFLRKLSSIPMKSR
jgi:hypothetical protein